jgi:hypothetical protein
MSADYKDIKHLLDLSEQILSGKELSDELNEETNSERSRKRNGKN